METMAYQLKPKFPFTWILARLLFCITFILSPATSSISHLRSPRITEQPKDVVVKKHEPTTLNCNADGNPVPTIEWYKDGEKVRNTGNRMMLPSGSLFFLHVLHHKRDGGDTGVYWCVARNEVGKARSRNASVGIAFFREEFKSVPKSNGVIGGETTVLECLPPRGHPPPVVSWKKDGKMIPLGKPGTGRIRLINGSNLKISEVRSTDSGRYVCIAENPVGLRESPPAQLNVYVKPFFTKTPQDVTSLEDETVEFECRAGGDPSPTVTWTKKDGKIPVGRAEIKDDKSLRIKHVTGTDEGLYICEVENQGGILSYSAKLTVHSRPSFLLAPQNMNVPLNGDAKLDCLATGNPAPSLFWSREGNEILMFPGKSYGRTKVTKEGTLVIVGVEKEDQGYYFCSAISLIGSSIGKAYLTVIGMSSLPPPIIKIGPLDQVIPEESLTMLTCEISPLTPAIVRWLFNERPIPLEEARYVILDSGTLQIDGVKLSDSGIYTCIAKNENGETYWSASLTVKSPHDLKAVFNQVPVGPTDHLPAPSKPVATNITETSVTLAWKRAENYSPSKVTNGYTLEYYSSYLPNRWTVAGRHIKAEHFIVRDLKVQTSYIFCVRAESEKGLGYPSPLSDEIYTLTSKSYVHNPELNQVRHSLSLCQVSLREASPLNSTSIKLIWDTKCSSNSESNFIQGFNIRYRDLSNGYHQNYELRSIRSRNAFSLVMTRLKPFTIYECFVVPFHESIQGPPSNLKTVETSEDVPSTFPDNLSVKVINGSSVDISWTSLPHQTINGVLHGYNVQVESDDQNKLIKEFNVSATDTRISIKNLTSGKTYHVSVSAFTTIGKGPSTPKVPLRFEPGYSYSWSMSETGNFPDVFKKSRFDSVAKEPMFILSTILIMFLFSSLILILVARKHLGWKKTVGAYITVQLNKCDEVEKCVFNGGGSLLGGGGGGGSTKSSWLHNGSDGGLCNGDAGLKLSGRRSEPGSKNYPEDVKQPFCNSNGVRNYGINRDDNGCGYYAEVEGHSMVTFGKKESGSTEPYATTTLMNTYHRESESHHSGNGSLILLGNGIGGTEQIKGKIVLNCNREDKIHSNQNQSSDSSSLDQLLQRHTNAKERQDTYSKGNESDSGSDVYGISIKKFFNQSKRFHPSLSASSGEGLPYPLPGLGGSANGISNGFLSTTSFHQHPSFSHSGNNEPTTEGNEMLNRSVQPSPANSTHKILFFPYEQQQIQQRSQNLVEHFRVTSPLMVNHGGQQPQSQPQHQLNSFKPLHQKQMVSLSNGISSPSSSPSNNKTSSTHHINIHSNPLSGTTKEGLELLQSFMSPNHGIGGGTEFLNGGVSKVPSSPSVNKTNIYVGSYQRLEIESDAESGVCACDNKNSSSTISSGDDQQLVNTVPNYAQCDVQSQVSSEEYEEDRRKANYEKDHNQRHPHPHRSHHQSYTSEDRHRLTRVGQKPKGGQKSSHSLNGGSPQHQPWRSGVVTLTGDMIRNNLAFRNNSMDNSNSKASKVSPSSVSEVSDIYDLVADDNPTSG